MVERIAVLGLGYVGLPVAKALANHYPVVGFDIDPKRIALLNAEAPNASNSNLTYSQDPTTLSDCTFYVVAVPTPINDKKQPDLTPLREASRIVGNALKSGDIVVYESTVYPGVTEEVCGPILEELSGLEIGRTLGLGYSPERINPGDTEHTLKRVIKVVSADSDASLERVSGVYSKVVEAGLHRAESIRVAEAAKVVENTQRDLNIALMNELALIFDRLNIPTRQVLRAARTKWNFLHFDPGLVGGHCLGVDPYYLTAKAKEVGYHPEIILAGRRINDRMGIVVAQRLVKMLGRAKRPIQKARVGIMGMAYKKNVPDCRNSRVPELVQELCQFGVQPMVCDPLVDPDWVYSEYGTNLIPQSELTDLDGIVLAVPHNILLGETPTQLTDRLRPGGALIDVTGIYEGQALREDIDYWCL